MTLPLVIITGLSGAGRTTALKALEDQGYQTIDNLPLLMMPSLVDHVLDIKSHAPIAIGLRTIDFSIPQAEMLLKNLQDKKNPYNNTPFTEEEIILINDFLEKNKPFLFIKFTIYDHCSND